MKTNRRFLVPEIVQTSEMDCGPAALKCLLEGFRIPASYDGLRQACHTDVDGTSIDVMEATLRRFGLEVEQVMVPADHLFLTETCTLPAVVVVRLPSGVPHSVVAWRRHGPYLQVMDPAAGRRCLSRQQLLDEIYLHTHPVVAADWRHWAGSEECLVALRSRLLNLRIAQNTIDNLVCQALADRGWRSMAALEAAVRMLDSMAWMGTVSRGPRASTSLKQLMDQPESIPSEYWSVEPGKNQGPGEEELLLHGAVVLVVQGRLAGFRQPASATSPSPQQVPVLNERHDAPGQHLLRLLGADGLLAPGVLILAALVAAGGVIFEAVLFRSVFELGRDLSLSGQRVAAIGMLLTFLVLLLLLELPLTGSLLRLGRQIEMRFRVSFLRKLPKLGDGYFRTRLTSDLAERSHNVHRIRELPELAGLFLKLAFELVLTTAGIIWLDPRSAVPAIITAAVVLGLPLATQPVLVDRDLRFRTHLGALSRFYLDALRGLMPIRAHGAERAIRREQERLLVEWSESGLRFQRAIVWSEAVQSVAGFGLVAWFLSHHLSGAGEKGGMLLMAYWALNLPVLGQQIALIARQYPGLRNVALRLMEPLTASEEIETETSIFASTPAVKKKDRPVSISMRGVNVRANGNTILEDLNLDISPGSHVAIVGASGAGKSSLVGLLLGWHRPCAGEVLVDGEPLGACDLMRLRRETAWVDPSVQLWNCPLIDNLTYGTNFHLNGSIAKAIEESNLRAVLETLPDGLKTTLGEAGALLSGGEGQRVRLARALLRPDMRLVILDEPFRGLDPEQRCELLARCRNLWTQATLLCITHDIGATRSFDRVLVMEQGRIVEGGRPAELAGRPDSRYLTMLKAERTLHEEFCSHGRWRRLRFEDGRLKETILRRAAW